MKKNKKKVVFEIFKEGDFIYAQAPVTNTKKEWQQIIGVYQTLIDFLKKKEDDKTWIN